MLSQAVGVKAILESYNWDVTHQLGPVSLESEIFSLYRYSRTPLRRTPMGPGMDVRLREVVRLWWGWTYLPD